MAVTPDMTFRAGDVVTVQGTVRYRTDPGELLIAVTLGTDHMVVYAPRGAITDVRPVLDDGDLVEHTTSGREGLVRHVHDALAWIVWSDNAVNTITPVADLIRRRTALEMAAVAEPDVQPPEPLEHVAIKPPSEESGGHVHD
jgi:hypothetical protein